MISQDVTACATRFGSAGSSGGGVWLVLTLQKEQPRVHVSPIIMIVAVAAPSFPPQHSPMLGHRASSHTVARLRLFTDFDKRSRFSRRWPVGVSMRSHEGFGKTEPSSAGEESTEVGAQPAAAPENDVSDGASSSSCARKRAKRAAPAGALGADAELNRRKLREAEYTSEFIILKISHAALAASRNSNCGARRQAHSF